jgi:hypothetical protein
MLTGKGVERGRVGAGFGGGEARTMGSGGYIYVHDILLGSVARDGGVMVLHTHCNITNTPSVPSFEIRGQRSLIRQANMHPFNSIGRRIIEGMKLSQYEF